MSELIETMEPCPFCLNEPGSVVVTPCTSCRGTGLVSVIHLPGEFEPCVMELNDAGVTEMVLRDCTTIWRPWGSEGVDLGYDEDGELVAIRIPGLVGEKGDE